jgi:CRP/FNR family transcriptional regulator, nitrogen oxide reductase regulator
LAERPVLQRLCAAGRWIRSFPAITRIFLGCSGIFVVAVDVSIFAGEYVIFSSGDTTSGISWSSRRLQRTIRVQVPAVKTDRLKPGRIGLNINQCPDKPKRYSPQVLVREEIAMTHAAEKKISMPCPKLFEGLADDAIAAIMGQSETELVPAKNMIITGGEKATHMYLLKAGQAKYFRHTKAGDELMFRMLTPGDIFGLGTLLEHPPAYMGSAATISECQIAKWKHKTVRALAESYPKIAENALRIVIQYLANYADRHTGLLTKTAEERLAVVLVSLAQRGGQVDSHGIKLKATNEQLGALADTSHFNVSRILSRWHREGTVLKERGSVIVEKPEGLPLD